MFRWLSIFVLLFAAGSSLCLAQTPSATSGTTEQSQTHHSTPVDAAAKNAARKKIWTNENLSEASGPVSVVGDKHGQKYTATPAKPADPATISRIRENLQKLESQLDEVTLQLSSFKEFQEGETVTRSSMEIQKGYTRMPINQQMAVLRDKKKKLELQLDTLFEEARKKGIDPGALR